MIKCDKGDIIIEGAGTELLGKAVDRLSDKLNSDKKEGN